MINSWIVRCTNASAQTGLPQAMPPLAGTSDCMASILSAVPSTPT